MMLSSLPPELLREIIERTVPHTYHSTTYQDRQGTLRSLCLVSHRFRHIAQPLLCEILRVGNGQILEFNWSQMPRNTKALILNDWRSVADRATFGSFLRGCQSLRSLALCLDGGSRLDLSILSHCPHLVDLQLSHEAFDTTVCTQLNALQTLTVNHIALEQALPLLDPSVLPSLRTLALRALRHQPELTVLQTSRISQLLPQLDAVLVELELFRLAQDNLLAGFQTRTLVNAHFGTVNKASIDLFTMLHLRLWAIPSPSPHKKTQYITRLSSLLAALRLSGSLSLQSIYLDPTCRPSAADSPNDYSRQFAQLEEECARGGVDLIFEDHQAQTWSDSWLSKEFSRRQRKKREAGQIEEVDGK